MGNDDDNASDKELIKGAKVQMKRQLKKSVLCYIKGIEEPKSEPSSSDSEDNWCLLWKVILYKPGRLEVQFSSLNFHCFIEGPYSISYTCLVYSLYHLIGIFHRHAW